MSKKAVMDLVKDLEKQGCKIEVCADMYRGGYESYLELSLWIHTTGWSFENGDRSCCCYYDQVEGGASSKWAAALDDLRLVTNVPVRGLD